jgi:protein disulfide-isomerase A6
MQGFPTIKIFGADKKKPVDYAGQRTTDGLVSEAMKAVNGLVKQRKAGKTSSSSSSDKKDKSKKGGNSNKSNVVELTEANFNALVMESNEQWLVEFYAPWCGHCQKLAPEWESAAKRLAGDGVKLGAVDATVHGQLAAKYGVSGYPTIKLFPAGPKGAPKDYRGAREADAIVDFALTTLEASGAPVTVNQLVNTNQFQDACAGQNAKLCVVLFVPHILDSGAAGRNGYLTDFQEIATGFRKMPFSFLWTEGTAQSALENALEINNNFPNVAVVSLEKGVYAVPKMSWSKKNVEAFLKGVLAGS